MDGRGIAAALRLGASAAQLGTAFILAPESAATPHHRALMRDGCAPTAMTDAIAGRAARGIVNRYFDEIDGPGHPPVPDDPIAYDAAKALHAAAFRRGSQDHSVNWAGRALARAMAAAELVAVLAAELDAAR